MEHLPLDRFSVIVTCTDPELGRPPVFPELALEPAPDSLRRQPREPAADRRRDAAEGMRRVLDQCVPVLSSRRDSRREDARFFAGASASSDTSVALSGSVSKLCTSDAGTPGSESCNAARNDCAPARTARANLSDVPRDQSRPARKPSIGWRSVSPTGVLGSNRRAAK